MKIKKVPSRILVAVVALYAVVCLLVYFFQEKLLFHPEKLSDNFKFEFSNIADESFIKSKTGNEINNLFFKADSSKGLVIYFHGNGGCLRTWGDASNDFLKNHYDVAIIDYPGYGKSKGNISEENLFNDAQSIYDELKKKYDESKIIICGRSIGTGIAAHLASENNPKKLILESPYYSMIDLGHHLYPWLPAFLSRYPLHTDECLPKIKCPVIVFHGTNDEVIYYESSLKLQKLFRPGDELITIQGGHHNDLKTFDEYQVALERVLN